MMSVLRNGWVRSLVYPVFITMILSAFIVIGFTAGQSEWKTSPRKAKKKNPIAVTPDSIAKGRMLYKKHCVSCHGDDGKGKGPAAKDLERKPSDHSDPKMWDESDGSLFWKTKTGRTPMPSFAPLMTDEEMWSTINFIRTFAPKPMGTPPLFEATDHQRSAISRVLKRYFSIQKYLAEDKLTKAMAAVRKLEKAYGELASIDVNESPNDTLAKWKLCLEELQTSLGTMKSATDLESIRLAFKDLSDVLQSVMHQFGHAETLPPRVMKCSMAFDKKGAIWIQREKEVQNPYFGKAMLKCGEEQSRLGAQQETK